LGVLGGYCELFKVDQGGNQVGFIIVTFTNKTQSTTSRLTLMTHTNDNDNDELGKKPHLKIPNKRQDGEIMLQEKTNYKLSHTMPYFKCTKRFDLHNFPYCFQMFQWRL